MEFSTKIYVVTETCVCKQDHLVLANSDKEALDKMSIGEYYDLDNIPYTQGTVDLTISELKENDKLKDDPVFKKAYSKLLELPMKRKSKKEYEPN